VPKRSSVENYAAVMRSTISWTAFTSFFDAATARVRTNFDAFVRGNQAFLVGGGGFYDSGASHYPGSESLLGTTAISS
jgi:hypothetical protein